MGFVNIEIKDSVATLTINRAEQLNALSSEVLGEIEAVLSELDLSRAKLLVFCSAGEKAFIAGADIKQMSSLSVESVEDFIALGNRVMNLIQGLDLVTIAVLQGAALGGGLELALACDLIVSSKHAKLGQPEVNLGLIPGFGGTQRLALRTGIGRARRLILTAQVITAEEALHMGLVDYCVEADALQTTVSELTKTLLSKGPLALAAAKKALSGLYMENLENGLCLEQELFCDLFSYQDTKEGLTAFLEKRKANFQGK
ncbi:enoyl-CoA hydratase/isomerase family protein [bacterium]|nr:enoyl-CoA hydratase/isomerase family protein [bacterium]